MDIGFISLGILCLVYYILLVVYSRRLSVTFGWFWIAAGVFHILLGKIIVFFPQWAVYILQGIMILCWIIFAAIEIVMLSAMLVLPMQTLDYVIVLGAKVRKTKVTESLKRRLDKALAFLQEHPEAKCIVSGGQGKGEDISEAQAMREYLIACGIEKERIVMEDKSTSTYENLTNSLEVVDDVRNKKVGIVTNNFHIYRAMKMAKHIGYKKVYALPASCNMVFFVNYMVREFFSVLLMMYRMWKKRA